MICIKTNKSSNNCMYIFGSIKNHNINILFEIKYGVELITKLSRLNN